MHTLRLILCCCVARDKGATCSHHRPVLVVVVGDENAGRAPANPPGMEQRMQKRRRIQQTESLENGLTRAIVRLRQQAGGTPPGLERERLIRRAREAKTASHINEWRSSRVANRTKLRSERSVDARERFACNL